MERVPALKKPWARGFPKIWKKFPKKWKRRQDCREGIVEGIGWKLSA
jgi:hypothetical protein